MRGIQEQGIRLVVIALLFTLISQTVASQDLSGSQSGAQQAKCIPVSVTAEVLVGGASIGRIDPMLEISGVPFNISAVLFPPSKDSFITLNIALPPDLSVDQPPFIEILFTGDIPPPSPTEATARLSLIFHARLIKPVQPGPISGVGGDRMQSIEVSGGLRKATFGILLFPSTAQFEVLTIQIGRLADSSAEDTYPGVVQVQAMRFCYVPQ